MESGDEFGCAAAGQFDGAAPIDSSTIAVPAVRG